MDAVIIAILIMVPVSLPFIVLAWLASDSRKTRRTLMQMDEIGRRMSTHEFASVAEATEFHLAMTTSDFEAALEILNRRG